MTFEDLIDAMNSRNDRKPGQWTPGACAVWRRVEPQDARLLEAMVAWELTNHRHVQPSDEDEVRQRLAQMDAATAEVKAARRMNDDGKTTDDTLDSEVPPDITTIDTLDSGGVTDIIPFDFEKLAVRVMDRAGNPWFVLADVCRVLGLKNPSTTAKSLEDDEITTIDTRNLRGITDPRAQQVRIISESGLYSLILTSRKPAAKRFKKWVTAEVLPTIRKTGSYSTTPAVDPMQALNDPATLQALLLSFNNKVPSL